MQWFLLWEALKRHGSKPQRMGFFGPMFRQISRVPFGKICLLYMLHGLYCIYRKGHPKMVFFQ